MSGYQRSRKQVEAALRKSRVVVVMNKSHINTPEHMVTTMQAVYQAGLVAEVTFRLDQGIIRQAMDELVKIRAASPTDNRFLLAVGSVINPQELQAAIEMGFDMVVAPANVMGGHGQGRDFIRITRDADVFSAPAVFTPTELNYFIERNDDLEPDAVKIFPARSHGPKGLSDLLAPFVRQRHRDRIIMPTGGVDHQSGPEYIKAITSRGFTPVLGMSSPLKLVVDRGVPGQLDTIVESLNAFKEKFQQ